GDGVETGDTVHQGGLARSRWAHDGGVAASFEADGDAVEGPHSGVGPAVDLDRVDDLGGERRGLGRDGGGGGGGHATSLVPRHTGVIRFEDDRAVRLETE